MASPGSGAPRKVFGTPADLWTIYRARLLFRDKLMGGVPKDPRLIEGWLRSRAGIIDSAQLGAAVLATMAEVASAPLADGESAEAIGTAAEALRRTTGFKLGHGGLYVESRQVKAMLKESTNIVFVGERWGPTRKSPKSFIAERVFVRPDQLWIGVQQPHGVETVVGHLSGPGGPRSTLTNYEYVERAELEFEVLVLRDCITADQWRDIWCHAQENGFGTLRSQGFGRFDVLQWEPVMTPPV